MRLLLTSETGLRALGEPHLLPGEVALPPDGERERVRLLHLHLPSPVVGVLVHDVIRRRGGRAEAWKDDTIGADIGRRDQKCTKRQNELLIDVWKLFSRSSTDVPVSAAFCYTAKTS